MAKIEISNLHFSYDDGTAVFENVNLTLDTSWRLGLIGRNGRGKTTFLKILSGALKARGTILSPVPGVYYPNPIANPDLPALEAALEAYPTAPAWRVRKEASLTGFPEEALERPLSTLSGGETTKIMLAALFASFEEQDALFLVDEPATHLDLSGREMVRSYLSKKSGFIVVSHDRALIDECADHVLAINLGGLELESGNYSSWLINKERRDQFEASERARLQKKIAAQKEASQRTAAWAAKTEKGKYGSGPVDRGYIGAKAAKMAKKAKSFQKRSEKAIEAKEALLRNVEKPAKLIMTPARSRSGVVAEARSLFLGYSGAPIVTNLDLTISRNEIVALSGPNGAGKTLIAKAVAKEIAPLSGALRLAPDLLVSMVPQIPRPDFGLIADLARSRGVEESRLKAVLSHLGLEKSRLASRLADLSSGQLKKVFLAASLCDSASLYIWDEPLSHIDVAARTLIEEALIRHRPAMLLIEHDQAFVSRVADRVIELPPGDTA